MITFYIIRSSESERITDAAYGSLRYNVHVNKNRIITFLILKLQKWSRRLRICLWNVSLQRKLSPLFSYAQFLLLIDNLLYFCANIGIYWISFFYKKKKLSHIIDHKGVSVLYLTLLKETDWTYLLLVVRDCN